MRRKLNYANMALKHDPIAFSDRPPAMISPLPDPPPNQPDAQPASYLTRQSQPSTIQPSNSKFSKLTSQPIRQSISQGVRSQNVKINETGIFSQEYKLERFVSCFQLAPHTPPTSKKNVLNKNINWYTDSHVVCRFVSTLNTVHI